MKGLAPFERRLGRRTLLLGEGSEGAVQAPSDQNAGVRLLERRLLRWQHPV
ncbi:MAG TPA: hypothetical protein VID04_16745 [Methylomirabilota bacterium]|jgi:hypothetical protein